MENWIMKQINHDREVNAYFNGVYSQPDGVTAGDSVDTMQGIKKLVDDGLSTGNMNEIVLNGGITAANAFDQVETFVSGISEDHLVDDIVMFMSHTNAINYHRDRRNTHGQDTNFMGKKSTPDFYDNVEIIPVRGFAGSDYIVATPKSNFLHLTKGEVKAPIMERDKRKVALMTDWWEGLGFGLDELVYVYQAPGSSSSSS